MEWTLHKNGNIPTKKAGELRVLSIDGGGMKGIIPAIYLKHVEEYLGEPIYKYFDLIAGTSTGGIIALGLSIGMSAEDISDIYIKEGEGIFKKKKFSFPGIASFLFSSKYKNEYLKETLQSKFADHKIKDAYTMLCIPSIEHHNAEPKVFKTPHHNDFYLDGERYMWEVGLATSAAPTYFPAASISEQECKIDGGLWANNPILVAVAEGMKLGFRLDQVKVLSLGTGTSIYTADNKIAEKGGLLSWKNKLVDLVFQTQTKAATYTANYLLGDNICRLSPTFARPLSLDSVKQADIEYMIREANQYYEKTFINKEVLNRFFKSEDKDKLSII